MLQRPSSEGFVAVRLEQEFALTWIPRCAYTDVPNHRYILISTIDLKQRRRTVLYYQTPLISGLVVSPSGNTRCCALRKTR
jgi:hypothetical protein